VTMENENTGLDLEQISELPLDERAAAFTVLEREIRLRLDERPH
jgi:hypothetical protein